MITSDIIYSFNKKISNYINMTAEHDQPEKGEDKELSYVPIDEVGFESPYPQGHRWFAVSLITTQPIEMPLPPIYGGGDRMELTHLVVRKVIRIRDTGGHDKYIPIGQSPPGFHPEDLPVETINYEEGLVTGDEPTPLEEAMANKNSVTLYEDTDERFREAGGEPSFRRPKSQMGGFIFPRTSAELAEYEKQRTEAKNNR